VNIIIALLVVAILALVHEWGHFVVARRIGVPVHEFAVGYGPALFSTRKNGVRYSLRVIPLGGYVKMAGEDPGDLEAENGFARRKPWEKIAVAAAGPLMNFVFAIAVFIVLFAVIGMPRAVEEPVIGDVLAGRPAAVAGLIAGDRILAVNGTPVTGWLEFTQAISALPVGEEALLQLDRAGQVFAVTLVTEVNGDTGRAMIGVTNQVVYEREGWLAAIRSGFIQTYSMTAALLTGLADMLGGRVGADDLAGPVGIISMIGDTARAGWLSFLSFTAFLSINLGVLNLLPIPALDGSRIVFALIEGVRRKPIPLEKEAMIHWLGFLFLIGLILLVTYQDVTRLFEG
jgi:regulator of sigma E protease